MNKIILRFFIKTNFFVVFILMEKITNAKREIQLDNYDAYYIDISPFKNTGLCNQLFLLIHSIAVCIKRKKPVLFIGKFRLEAYTLKKCNASRVFDFELINTFLSNKYKLLLFDEENKKDFEGQIMKIETDVVFCSANVNSPLGNEIFDNLHFQKEIILPSEQILNVIKHNNKSDQINVIHLRIEPDAIKHWSDINKISYNAFEKLVSNKYIEFIKNDINKNDATIILTGSKSNNVLEFLKLNGYKHFLCKKPSNYREINAIFDLLLGKNCSNVFIGAGGSTFTQLLANSYKSNVKTKIFNLNDIREQ